MEFQSDFLYARPSFCEGVARIIDFGNTLNQYNESPSGEIADRIALSIDWAVVGNAIDSTARAFEREMQGSTK